MQNLKFFLKRVCWGLALLVVVVACDKGGGGYDNPNYPDDPYKPVSDPEGTILVAMRNLSNGSTNVTPDGCGGYFYIGKDDNFYGEIGSYSRWKFTFWGQCSGLGNVTSIPASGWADQVAVVPGHGYVGMCPNRYNNPPDTTYVRFYVTEYMTAASGGGIIGAYVKYQSPFVP